MRKQYTLALLLGLACSVSAQFSINTIKTTHIIDFNNTISGVNIGAFSAPSGFATENPIWGELDRDAFQVSATQGSSFNWPATPVDGTNGGGEDDGTKNQHGVYAYSNNGGVNRFLGIRPTSGKYSPGAIILKVQNNSGHTATQFEAGYTGYAFNKSSNSAQVQFYWSVDGSSWTAVQALGFNSTGTANNAWEDFNLASCIGPLKVEDGGFLYLKWVINENSPSGQLDPIGIDNIQLMGRTPVVGFVSNKSIVQELNPDGTTTQTYDLDVYMDAPPIDGPAILGVHTVNGSATPITDYASIPANFVTLTFNPTGCYPQTKQVTLSLKKDTDIEANEDFNVQLTLTTPTATATDQMSHQVIIANDDVPANGKVYSQAVANVPRQWDEAMLWNSESDGSGDWVPDPDNLLGNAGPQLEVYIQPGHIIYLNGDKNIQKLIIDEVNDTKGQLMVGAGPNVYFLKIHGDNIDIDGILGNGTIPDGIGLEINSPFCTITGERAIDLNKIRKGGTNNTVLEIKNDVNLRGTGTVFYNDSDGHNFDVTVDAGKTVTVQYGNVSIDGKDGQNSKNGKGTYTINGTVLILSGNLFLSCNNPLANSDDITYTIGSTGKVYIGGQVIGNLNNTGAAKINFNMAANAELDFGAVGTLFVDIDNNRNLFNIDPNSTIEFSSGFLEQVLPPLTIWGNLKLSGGSKKYLSAGATIMGTLTLNSGNLFLGDNDLRINPFGGSISGGSSTSYIKTDGTGSLIQQVGNGGTTIFPVGNDTYNPATMGNSGILDNFGVRVDNWVKTFGSTGYEIPEQVVDRTWFVEEQTPGGSVVTLILQWNSSNELPYFDRNNCYIGHYNNGIWEQSNIPAASMVSGSNFLLTTSGVTEFSSFYCCYCQCDIARRNDLLPGFAKG